LLNLLTRLKSYLCLKFKSMKNAFGRYISMVYCSFSRLTTSDAIYYIVSADIGPVIPCIFKQLRDGKWQLENNTHVYFEQNFSQIEKVLNLNENRIMMKETPNQGSNATRNNRHHL
jgi:hypothetical protein